MKFKKIKKLFKTKYITIKRLRIIFDVINNNKIFLNFSHFLKKFFPSKIKGKQFPVNQTNFSFD
jgi:hypothetical protein